jgi:segregation and condensation protein A
MKPSITEQVSESKSKFHLTLSNFTGPFDLLLHLIDEKQLDIYDVTISHITDAYLQYIFSIEHKNLDESSEFLMMAAALIEMKSNALLPVETQEEISLQEQIEQERVVLLNRLVQYKMYKKAAFQLAAMEDEFKHIFSRAPINEKLESISDEKQPIILKAISMNHLLRAFQRVWERAAAQEKSPQGQIFDDRYTVKEKMETIVHQLHEGGNRMKFTQLFSQNFNRLEVITTFLAVLELTRLKLIALVQSANYDEIEVVKREAENFLITDEEITSVQEQGVS